MKTFSKLIEYIWHPALNVRFHLLKSGSWLSKLNNPSCAYESDQTSFAGTKPMSIRMKSHPVELYRSRRQAQVTRGATKRGYHPNLQRQCRQRRQTSIQPGATSSVFTLPIPSSSFYFVIIQSLSSLRPRYSAMAMVFLERAVLCCCFCSSVASIPLR